MICVHCKSFLFCVFVWLMALFFTHNSIQAETSASRPAAAAGASDLLVMSFNLRTSTAKDGQDDWDHRRDLVVRTIGITNPDLLGTQECTSVQADYLQQRLGDYGFIGVGRGDGKRKGEFSAIFYRKSRFTVLDSGTFWLSMTPDLPGSKSWDSSLPRIVTWARLQDNVAGKSLMYLNTHWDHRGPAARLESAALIRKWIQEHAAELPVIITGDFNDIPMSPAHQKICESGPCALSDFFELLHPDDINGGGSFHGFTGKPAGNRIDWILGTSHFTVISAELDRSHDAGRYPSDHFPLTIRVHW